MCNRIEAPWSSTGIRVRFASGCAKASFSAWDVIRQSWRPSGYTTPVQVATILTVLYWHMLRNFPKTRSNHTRMTYSRHFITFATFFSKVVSAYDQWSNVIDKPAWMEIPSCSIAYIHLQNYIQQCVQYFGPTECIQHSCHCSYTSTATTQTHEWFQNTAAPCAAAEVASRMLWRSECSLFFLKWAFTEFNTDSCHLLTLDTRHYRGGEKQSWWLLEL